MLTVRDLVLDDGTCYVPHELHDTDQDYKKDDDFEKAIADKVKMDPHYKDLEHKPFIGWVKLLGRKPIRALLIPGTREELDKYLGVEDSNHKKEEYWNRCPISDGSGKLKQCPPQIPNPDYGKVPGASKTIMNRCEFCQIYRQWKNVSKNTSLEDMTFTDEGEERNIADFSNPAVSREDMLLRIGKILLDVAADKDSRVYKVVKQMLFGKIDADGDDNDTSINQVCVDLNYNPSGIYKALQSKKIREAVLDALSNDPLIEIEKLL